MSADDKAHGLFPSTRKAEIARLLDEVGQATVAELSERFGVSRDTVRRDLEDLSVEGIIVRQHGGAVSPRYQSSSEFPVPDRISENTGSKLRIGRKAATLIEDGMTILFNGGSTVLAVAEHLKAFQDLVVVTNNLMLPPTLQSTPMRELCVIGGTVRPLSQVTLGPVAFAAANANASHPIRADIAFIGVGGVAVQGGITISNVAEARMLREFINVSNRTVIVADSSKIGKVRFAQVAPLTGIDTLITDEEVPSEMAKFFEENKITVLIT